MALEDLKLNDETSGDLGGYFHVTITDLDLATQYPLQFQYIYADKRLNDNWSAVKYFTTVGATVPNEPQLQTTDVVGGAGFIKVAWSGNDAGGSPIANFDRVDVHISGTTFGDGSKAAGSFKSSGTQTFTCVAGVYIVQLKVYSLNGESSFFSTARTVTVTEVTEEIQTPVAPTGFSSSRILGGIEVAWAGTYGSAWTGFEAINIYAGTSSSATGGTYIKVGQMTANKISNKIVVPVDGTYVRYGVPVYIHASSVNRNGVESAISANVTSQSSGARSAIGTDLADEIISNAKLVNDAVTEAKIATSAITETKISNNAVTSQKIIANAITADKIVSGAIIADKIATNAITAGKILAGEIDVTKLSAGTISVNNLESGTLSATSFIRAGTAGSSRIEISSAAVSASSILAGLYIYNGSTAVLQAPLGGGLTITGSLTATQISTSSGNFSVNTSGVLTAKSAEIDGTIKATSGYIGGLTSGIYIAAGAIQNDVGGSQFKLDSSGKARFGSSTGNAIVINPTASNGGYYLYHTSGGQDGSASSVFSVSTSGILTATGGNFSGTITNGSDFWNADSSFRFGGTTGISYSGSGAVTLGSNTTIQGTIQATTGYIGGWFFNSTYLSNIQNSISSYYINASTGAMAMNNIFIRQSAGSNGIDLTNGSDLRMRGGTMYLGTGGSIDVSLASIKTGAGDIIDSSGNISTQGVLTVSNVGTKGSYSTTNDNIALIGVGGTSIVGRLYKVTSVSSRQFKENIEDIDSADYLNIINSLRPVKFNYKPDIVEDPEVKVYGLIAEEVDEIPGAEVLITYKDEEVYSVKYDRLPLALIKAIQQISERLDALEA
jgi:hypothetical protein